MSVFDTLDYTKGAEAVGIKREHAEYQAKQLSKLIDDSLATKNDLKDLEMRLIVRLGGLMIICSGMVISGLGFILKHT
jgi:hypothetical protein